MGGAKYVLYLECSPLEIKKYCFELITECND